MGAYLHIESTGSSPQAKLERGQSPVPSAIVVAASTTPPFPVFDRLLELLFFWGPRSSISPQAPLPHPSPHHITAFHPPSSTLQSPPPSIASALSTPVCFFAARSERPRTRPIERSLLQVLPRTIPGEQERWLPQSRALCPRASSPVTTTMARSSPRGTMASPGATWSVIFSLFCLTVTLVWPAVLLVPYTSR